MGFRDSNQDVLGFVHLIPERARRRILDLAATQLSDGTCFHQYQPLTRQGNAEIGGDFYDDQLWLVVVHLRVREGDRRHVGPDEPMSATRTRPEATRICCTTSRRASRYTLGTAAPTACR